VGKNYFIFNIAFSLFFPMLSPLSNISSSSPTAGKGVPAVVGRPVRRRHRVGTLFFIFLFFSDLYPYSGSNFSLKSKTNKRR